MLQHRQDWRKQQVISERVETQRAVSQISPDSSSCWVIYVGVRTCPAQREEGELPLPFSAGISAQRQASHSYLPSHNIIFGPQKMAWVSKVSTLLTSVHCHFTEINFYFYSNICSFKWVIKKKKSFLSFCCNRPKTGVFLQDYLMTFLTITFVVFVFAVVFLGKQGYINGWGCNLAKTESYHNLNKSKWSPKESIRVQLSVSTGDEDTNLDHKKVTSSVQMILLLERAPPQNDIRNILYMGCHGVFFMDALSKSVCAVRALATWFHNGSLVLVGRYYYYLYSTRQVIWEQIRI